MNGPVDGASLNCRTKASVSILLANESFIVHRVQCPVEHLLNGPLVASVDGLCDGSSGSEGLESRFQSSLKWTIRSRADYLAHAQLVVCMFLCRAAEL